MAIESYLSIITLNINGLNAPTKRHRLAEWIQKQDPICYLHGEGNGTRLQYSCLENPMDGEVWWAAVHGVAKSQTQLSD